MRTKEEIIEKLTKEAFQQVLEKIKDGSFDREAERIFWEEQAMEEAAEETARLPFQKRFKRFLQLMFRNDYTNLLDEFREKPGVWKVKLNKYAELKIGRDMLIAVLLCEAMALWCQIACGSEMGAWLMAELFLTGLKTYLPFWYVCVAEDKECKAFGEKLIWLPVVSGGYYLGEFAMMYYSYFPALLLALLLSLLGCIAGYTASLLLYRQYAAFLAQHRA